MGEDYKVDCISFPHSTFSLHNDLVLIYYDVFIFNNYVGVCYTRIVTECNIKEGRTGLKSVAFLASTGITDGSGGQRVQ